ncbi:hypothetical protein MPER_09644 [Moniliophthora perniciosa FA553]|nr:hypothetical protein MPER_09644 [Moniliophthora perniciosa FA553]
MDDVSYPDSPAGDPSDLPLEKHKLALQTYLTSVPYECESNDVMQARLEEIVGKIYVCAKTQNWLTLTTWDGMLQCWLLMRYPMEKTIRAKLVRLYYDLCTLPGIDPRVIRSWADMVSRLICDKGGGKRKLESQDLQLPWQALRESSEEKTWPKKRIEKSLCGKKLWYLQPGTDGDFDQKFVKILV